MNVDPTLLILLVELLVLETLALLVIGILFVRRKVQYKNMMKEIIESADASEAARQKVLEQTLKDVFHEGGEEACSKAKQLAEAESRFSKRLISAFVARQHEILNRLDKMTDELISPYRAIISETAEEKMQNEQQADKRIHTLKHTIDALKEEKEKISQRLQETEEELERITAEYVSAFKKEELLREEVHRTGTHSAARQPEPATGGASAAARNQMENGNSAEHAVEEPAAADQTESEDPGVESHTEAHAESGTAEASHDSGIETDTETDAEISVQDDAASQTAEQAQEEEGLLQLREEDAPDPTPQPNPESDPEPEPESAPEPEPRSESEPESELEQDSDQDGTDEASSGTSADTVDTGAILEDVDIKEAPLMEELVKENAVKSAAGR